MYWTCTRCTLACTIDILDMYQLYIGLHHRCTGHVSAVHWSAPYITGHVSAVHWPAPYMYWTCIRCTLACTIDVLDMYPLYIGLHHRYTGHISAVHWSAPQIHWTCTRCTLACTIDILDMYQLYISLHHRYTGHVSSVHWPAP